MLPFTPDQLGYLTLASRISSGLSIFGSSCVILNTIFRKDSRTTVNRLVFYMSVCDLIAAVFLLLARYPLETNDDALCLAQGMVLQFSLLASILWTSSIAVNLLILFAKKVRAEQLHRYEIWYCFFNFSVALGIALSLVFWEPFQDGSSIKGVYGDSNLWCWIVGTDNRYDVFRIGFFFAPLWVIFAFNFVVYVYVGVVVAQISKCIPRDALEQRKNLPLNVYIRRTVLYLLAILICWVPASVNEIYSLLNPTAAPIFIIFLLEAIFTPLQGFLNAVAYFFASIIFKDNQALRTMGSPFKKPTSDTEKGIEDTNSTIPPTTPMSASSSRTFFAGISHLLRRSSGAISPLPNTANSNHNTKSPNYGLYYINKDGRRGSTIPYTSDSGVRLSTSEYVSKEFFVDPALLENTSPYPNKSGFSPPPGTKGSSSEEGFDSLDRRR